MAPRLQAPRRGGEPAFSPIFAPNQSQKAACAGRLSLSDAMSSEQQAQFTWVGSRRISQGGPARSLRLLGARQGDPSAAWHWKCGV